MKQVKIVQDTTDELDLLALLEKAISFFTHYGKLLAGVALTGMLVGLLVFWRIPNVYSSSLLLQPVLLTSPEQMQLVNSWTELLKKKEYQVLAAQWQVDRRLLDNLRSIEAEEVQKTFSPTNFTAFTLTVKVTDTALLPTLQKGILYALDNGEYIKDKLASRKNMLRSLIRTIDDELSRLNNMQSTVEKNMQTTNTSGPGLLVDVSGIGSQIATLEEKKLNLQESLTFTSSVHALQNFYTPDKPEPKLLKFLFIGCAMGIMMGGAASLLIHVRRKMKIRAHEK